jgi:hypothetical protein
VIPHHLRELIEQLSADERRELRRFVLEQLAEVAAEPFGTWTDDDTHPRCPLCGVQVKWSVGDTSRPDHSIRARCQDGTRVSRRFPGFGPACPWAGADLVRAPDGRLVFAGAPSTAWVAELAWPTEATP